MCYFYALKASKKLFDAKQTEKVLKIGFVTLLVILAIVLITQYIEIHLDKRSMCHTFSFVVPQLLNCIVSFGFIAIGFKIQKAVSHELNLKR